MAQSIASRLGLTGRMGTTFEDLLRMRRRDLLLSAMAFAMVVANALAIWKGIALVTGSHSPVVVVLSGSMLPAIHRGDILLLTGFANGTLDVGDIVVYNVNDQDIPIIHRALERHWGLPLATKHHPRHLYLTKGDNNNADDRGLYKRHQKWLEETHMLGKAVARAPWFGMPTIWLSDYPVLKHAMIVSIAFTTLLHRGNDE